MASSLTFRPGTGSRDALTVEARGKSFFLGPCAFPLRGLRWSPDAALTTDDDDSVAVTGALRRAVAAGYNVLTIPAAHPLVEPIMESGVRCLIELNVDLLALASTSRRERARFERSAAAQVRAAIHRWAGAPELLGVCLRDTPGPGRESGASALHRAADGLALAIRMEAPALLLGWRAGEPLGVACPPDCDFLIVDLALATASELGGALMASHRRVGDRPLVLGDVVVRAGDEPGGLGWRMDAALRGGAAGAITTGCPPGDADVRRARSANERTVRALEDIWPAISIVVCAHNAEATIGECLRHCLQLDYPRLEVIVVDDGSTDRTAAITAAQGVRCLTLARGGLSAARNRGYSASTHEIVAYLDADAYPAPEWPWFLALAARDGDVAACGGPNVPPPEDPPAARSVARSSGGPVPQLLAPNRARHLPGCNMAFWRHALEALGGFDEVLEATEDVELEERLLAHGEELGYHPAALVWHHRRAGVRPYLRQQQHYGRGQAIIERRYPERFPAGYRVRRAAARLCGRPPVGEGKPGLAVDYLSLAPAPDGRLELAHQWGVPAAAVLLATAPLALRHRRLPGPAAAGACALAALFALDVRAAGRGAARADRAPRARATVATLSMLRPLAFRWGHLQGRLELARAKPSWPPPPRPSESPAAAHHGGDRAQQDSQVEPY